MSRSYSAADIAARLDRTPEAEVEITLRRRERAWHPEPSRRFLGPCVVRYTRYPDASVGAEIVEDVR